VGEGVEVRRIPDDPLRHELVDQLLAEVVDVHRLAPGEVENPPLDLSGAGDVRAARDHLSLGLTARAPQAGQVSGIVNGLEPPARFSGSARTTSGMTSPAASPRRCRLP